MTALKTTKPEAERSRARLSFIGIVLLFALPLLLAVGLYAGGWRPLGRVNHGELINPPVDVSELRLAGGADGEMPPSSLLTGQWSVVHVIESPCGSACNDELYRTRQVRTALGKDAGRVQRVALTLNVPEPGAAAALRREYPDLVVAGLGAPTAWATDGSVLLVDPLGNMILRYPPGYESSGLLKDLKRLLKLSKVG